MDFAQVIQSLAQMAKVEVFDIVAPTRSAGGSFRTHTQEDAVLLAGMIAGSGLAAQAVSRNGRHSVFVG